MLLTAWARKGVDGEANPVVLARAFVSVFADNFALKLAKYSSSQLKNTSLSSGERFAQSISGSTEITGATWWVRKSGRVECWIGGGGPTGGNVLP